MSKSFIRRTGGGSARPAPKNPRLVVVRLRCDDPVCDGACIPPAYRRRAVPIEVVQRARAANPDGALRLLAHLAS